MGFFACISRRPAADSEALQKRDSQADFLPVKVRIPASRSPGSAKRAERRRTAGEVRAKLWPVRARDQTRCCRAHPLSWAAGDLAGIDVENFACCADLGEG